MPTFETISQACLDVCFYFPYASVFSYVYWLLRVSLLWFACLLPLSSALSGYLPFVVILALILLQLLALQISYPACLFTLCFLCLLCFQKSLPTSKNHKNGLPCFSSSFLNLIFKFTALISWNSFLSMLWVTILVFHMNGAFCTIYQIDHLNSNAVL